ncbi:hypothetical protein Tco_1531553, partial [Tanacetum coccineum]
TTHIKYALTENPTIYVSLIHQFWEIASATTNQDGEMEITATIDERLKIVTEASIRRHLKLEDSAGHFSPQWKFLIHTILHCLSPKKTAWDQFSSNIATAIICLAANRTFNFSKLIFDGMGQTLQGEGSKILVDSQNTPTVAPSTSQPTSTTPITTPETSPSKITSSPSLSSPTQQSLPSITLNKQKRLLQPHTQTYPTPILTQKVFSNMKRISRGYSRIDFALFPTMINAPETSPSRITSSPSLSPQHTPDSTSLTSQPPNTQPTPDAEETVPMPHESPLHSVHSLGRDEGSLSLSELTVLCTNLSNKVTSLEEELAQTKQTYGTALTKLIKKVKKLEQTIKSTQARRRIRIVVFDDEEGQEDPSKQGRKITEIDQDPSISLVHDEGTSWIQEKISDDTEVVLEEEEPTELVKDQEVSTAAANLVYIRRSAEKKKDKGKGIMTEPEPEKKTKMQLEQERLGHEEAVRFQEQLNEEETQRIARNVEIARQLHEEINKAGQERVVAKDDQAHGGYKMNYFKGMKYEDIRPIFEKAWDQIQSFAPMDSEKEKIEDDIEKEELKAYLDLVPREEFAMEVESLGTKYPIVDWKTYVLTENFMYYQIFRADRSSKNYKIFSEMLDDFDRQDVLDLHRLVKARYMTSSPEGYDLMLWGDLKTLFEPDEADEVWRNQ